MKRILITLLTILYITGCSTHLTDFTLLSNKNINLEKVDIDKLPPKQKCYR